MEKNKFKNKIEVIKGHKRERIIRNFSWIIAFLWMGLIFYMSAKSFPGPNEFSNEITGKIAETLDAITPGMAFNKIIFHEKIRKSAHFMAYFVLGILFVNALIKTRIFGFRCLFWTMMICSLYAAFDGFHQYFSHIGEGRITDVILNISGAFTGSFLLLILMEEIKMLESGELLKKWID